jgi:hypothetical protein
MIRETKVFILLLFFSVTNCFGQQLPNQVLVSAGGTATAGIISYSQSIGEPVVELLTGPDVILTQGFQQPHFKGPSDIPNPSGNGVNVYPNPATDVFYIQVFGDQPRKFNIELINLTGMILNSWKLEFSSAFNYKMPVDATRMRVGIYLVRVVSTDGIINRVFKIEKL